MKTLPIALLLLLCACAADEMSTPPPQETVVIEDEDSSSNAPPPEEVIRVACVGDSITYGSGIKDRGRNSYPAQLAEMLGPGWRVENFGVPGATMLKKGNKPYWNEEAFQEALEFNPNVVVIMLGTNDAKAVNWRHEDEFVSDYREMIDTFAKLDTNPWIWLCCPVPAYHEGQSINGSVVENEVVPEVRKVALKTSRPLIDLHSALSGRPYLFPDCVHPNAEGAAMMAAAVYREVEGRETP
jgi:lysophospholipase L1-like esterase